MRRLFLVLTLSTPALAQEAAEAPPADAVDAPTPVEVEELVEAAEAEATSELETELEEVDAEWMPPGLTLDGPPEAADVDSWVKLTSGEWLFGTVKEMRTGDLTFDSDKLGDVEIDNDDIEIMWVPRPKMYVLRDRSVVKGPAILVGDAIQIRGPDGIVEVERGTLLNIVDGVTELSLWSFRMDLGFSGRYGNSQQTTFNGSALLRRNGAVTRWTLGYEGSYGLTDKVEAVHWHKAMTELDIFVTRVLFFQPLTSEAYYDKFQNLLIRFRAGAGMGFRHEVSDDFTWEGTLGATYQRTEYLQPLQDAEQSSDDAGIQASLGFAWDITDDVDWALSWKSTIVVTDLDQTSQEGSTRLGVDITDALSLFTKATYTRIENPPTAEDGTKPKPDDVTVQVGASLDF